MEQRRAPFVDALVALLLVAGAFWLLRPLFFPLIGALHDDGQYVAYARGLAAGQGYVNPALPEHPPAGRYPIGFPALLALVAGNAAFPVAAERLAWVPAACGALFLALGYIYLRRWWPVAGAAAAMVTVGLSYPVLFLGSFLWSDLAYAAWAMAALVLLQRPRWWIPGMLAVQAAWLTRYAGVALVGAVVVDWAYQRRWKQLGAFLGLTGLVAGGWLAFRWRLGGEDYLANGTPFLGGDLGLGFRLQHVVGDLVAGSLPALVFPGLGASVVFGCLLGVLAAVGLSKWPREDGLLGPAFLVLTLVVTLGYAIPFWWYGAELTSRLLLPAAPVLWLAIYQGLEFGFKGRAERWRSLVLVLGLVTCVLSAVGGARRELGKGIAREAAPGVVADAFKALDVVRKLPATASVLSSYQELVYLYTGRTGHTLPADVDAHGLPAVLGPLPLLMTMEHWHVDHVVVLSVLGANEEANVAAVDAFMKAFPGVLAPLYANEGRRVAVYAVQRQPFEDACKANHIRERNQAFERQEKR